MTMLSIKIKLLREYGWKNKGISITDGGNYRIDELQAAILRTKLTSLDNDNNRRINIAQIYTSKLAKLVKTPKLYNNCNHVYHLYVIEVDNRSEIIERLNAKGIYPGIHYDPPAHIQVPFKSYAEKPLVNTNYIAKRILSLPIYPELPTEEVDYICESLISILKKS